MQRTIGGILVGIRATAILPGWARPYYNAAPGCDACAFVFQLRYRHDDSFHNDHFPDLKADFISANSPFNASDWGGPLFDPMAHFF